VLADPEETPVSSYRVLGFGTRIATRPLLNTRFIAWPHCGHSRPAPRSFIGTCSSAVTPHEVQL
jgi:hypothetical protein